MKNNNWEEEFDKKWFHWDENRSFKSVDFDETIDYRKVKLFIKSLLEQEKSKWLEALPKEKVCSDCGKEWSEEDRTYDGELHCRNVNCDGEVNNRGWDIIGWNACLQETRVRVNKLFKK
jgi:hypothetical protein